VGYSMMGDDGPSVYIAQEPEGYPGLKADARAIRREKGRGRVWIMSPGRSRMSSRAVAHPRDD
jgi:hypothetical protein